MFRSFIVLQGEVFGYEPAISMKVVVLESRMCLSLSFIYVDCNKVWLLTEV